MKIRGISVIILLFVFFVAVTVSHAEELPPEFVAADVNKDGKLSRDEVVACVNKKTGRKADELLQKTDVNGDGALTKDELKGKNLQKKMEENAEEEDL